MKQLLKYSLLFIVLVMPVHTYSQGRCKHFKPVACLSKEEIYHSPCGIKTLFLPRSQGVNLARRMSGWEYIWPGCDNRAWGNVYIAVEHERSLKPERLAQYLFGSTCLHFAGSQVAGRSNCRDILADNIGLPTNFVGKACFNPTIESWIVDINVHLGLDAWLYGLYFRLNIPITRTNWDIGLHCNTTSNIGPHDFPVFPPCYMGPTQAQTARSIAQGLNDCSFVSESGSAIANAQTCVGEQDFTYGDMKLPYTFGKFAKGKVHATAIADVDCTVGWNFILTDHSNLGIFVKTIIPTGTIPSASFIFEPIVGNGRLWELGGGVSAHTLLFESGAHFLRFYFEGYATYQFPRFQTRSYDFATNGPLSRYLLLKEFNAANVYDDNLISAVDYTTRATWVGKSTKGEVCVKLSYCFSSFGLDVGYNMYGRTQEKLRTQNDLFPSDLITRHFGVKGTEGICYRVQDTITGAIVGSGPLNSTQSTATITRAGPTDNPAPIAGLAPNEIALAWDNTLAFTSNPPVIIRPNNINLCSAQVPDQLTHKVFAHLHYIALENCWEPQIGIGGEYEWDGLPALLSSLNKWGVWLKVGVAF